MSRSTVIVRGRAELSGSHLLLIDLLSKLSTDISRLTFARLHRRTIRAPEYRSPPDSKPRWRLASREGVERPSRGRGWRSGEEKGIRNLLLTFDRSPGKKTGLVRFETPAQGCSTHISPPPDSGSRTWPGRSFLPVAVPGSLVNKVACPLFFSFSFLIPERDIHIYISFVQYPLLFLPTHEYALFF